MPNQSNPQTVILRSIATPVLSREQGKNLSFSVKYLDSSLPLVAQNDSCVSQGLDVSAQIYKHEPGLFLSFAQGKPLVASALSHLYGYYYILFS